MIGPTLTFTDDLRPDLVGPAPKTIRHHLHVSSESIDELFVRAPQPFASDDADRRSHGLGATLYLPGSKDSLSDRLHALSASCGLTSAVICLEDAVPDSGLHQAEANVIAEMERLAQMDSCPVMVFLRPRTPAHLLNLTARLDDLVQQLAGFVLPKFNRSNADEWLDAVDGARLHNVDATAMPVLEGPEVLHLEQRRFELGALDEILQRRGHLVSAIRVGATDLSGLLGIRRGPNTSVYELPALASCIGDILNRWGRADSRFTVTGPVWEYFRPACEGIDPGLWREASRDVENGMLGKSVIHPSHVAAVNALLAVKWEDWADAQAIITGEGGATASAHHDRMNEGRPHLSWAARVVRRGDIYGVLHDHVTQDELARAR